MFENTSERPLTSPSTIECSTFGQSSEWAQEQYIYGPRVGFRRLRWQTWMCVSAAGPELGCRGALLIVQKSRREQERGLHFNSSTCKTFLFVVVICGQICIVADGADDDSPPCMLCPHLAIYIRAAAHAGFTRNPSIMDASTARGLDCQYQLQNTLPSIARQNMYI